MAEKTKTAKVAESKTHTELLQGLADMVKNMPDVAEDGTSIVTEKHYLAHQLETTRQAFNKAYKLLS